MVTTFTKSIKRGSDPFIRPMLAMLEEAPLVDESLVYEPKYDGIRAIVEINPAAREPVKIWSRLGNDKTAQFPDLVAALARYAEKLKGAVVLDGEIVALGRMVSRSVSRSCRDASISRSRTADPPPGG